MQSQKSQSFTVFLEQIPFTNRLFIIIICLAYFSSFVDLFQDMFTNIIAQTVNSYQIWRIFTASFCISSLFWLLIIFINMYTVFPKLQMASSSISVFVNFLVSGTIIQIIYTSIGILLGSQNISSFGNIFGIWFCYIFKYCYFNGQQKIKLCCFPLKINKIVFPFIFAFILQLLIWQIRFDVLIGIFWAFIECKAKNGELIQFQNDGFLQFFNKFTCWVPAKENRSNTSPFEGIQNDNAFRQLSQASTDAHENHFQKMKGGVRLGGR